MSEHLWVTRYTDPGHVERFCQLCGALGEGVPCRSSQPSSSVEVEKAITLPLEWVERLLDLARFGLGDLHASEPAIVAIQREVDQVKKEG